MIQLVIRIIRRVLFADTSPEMTLPASTPLLFQDVVCLLPYKHTLVQTAITRNKYQHDSAAAAALGAVLHTHLQHRPFDDISIIPMPQSYRRWRERGFDHVRNILQHTHHHAHVRTDILKKSRHTDPQVRVSGSERRQQQAGTYTCQPAAAKTLTSTVILLDDVITTGATMQAASAALTPHLPRDTRLICLALAH